MPQDFAINSDLAHTAPMSVLETRDRQLALDEEIVADVLVALFHDFIDSRSAYLRDCLFCRATRQILDIDSVDLRSFVKPENQSLSIVCDLVI